MTTGERPAGVDISSASLLPSISRRLALPIAALVSASFLFTFAVALLRIYRQTPPILARRSVPWETLRTENHTLYRTLAPAIRETAERVPANGVILIENFRRVEHQFLANYLAPRRIFFVSTPELKQRNFGAAPVWILTLGNITEGRQEFRLERWDKMTSPEQR